MSYCGTALVRYLAQTTYAQVGMASDSELNSFLGTVIIEASRMIDSYCQRTFGSATIGTWSLDGNGKAVLFLPSEITPMIGISAGTVSNTVIPTSAIKIHNQYLELDGYTWTKGKKNVTLAGSYGILTGTPKDIEYIAAQLCANILNDMISKKLYPQMYTQATMQGKAISAFMVQSSIFSPTLKEMIEPYRVMWVDVG